MNQFEFTVNEEQAQTRVDKLLTDLMDDVSRSQIQIWIKDGHVTLNNEPVKSNYKVEVADQLTVTVLGRLS